MIINDDMQKRIIRITKICFNGIEIGICSSFTYTPELTNAERNTLTDDELIDHYETKRIFKLYNL